MIVKMKFLTHFTLAICIMMLCGCNKPKLELSITSEQAIETSQIEQVLIFVDCSGSMKGYVDLGNHIDSSKNNSFKRVIPTLITNIRSNICNNNSNKLSIYKVTNNNLTPQTESGFCNDLITGNIFGGTTTELDKMFTIVLDTLRGKKNKLSIIITDGVLSFGPNKLAENRMMNVANKNLLSNNIHRELSKDTTVSIAIVKYHADFNGKYYYNCKEQVEYNNNLLKNRPFYIIVLGNKDLVASFLKNEEILQQSEGVYSVSSPIELEATIFPKYVKGEKNTIWNFAKSNQDRKKSNATKEYKTDEMNFILAIKTKDIPLSYCKHKKIFFQTLKSDNPYFAINKCDKDIIRGNHTNDKNSGDYDEFYLVTINKDFFRKDFEKDSITFYFDNSLNPENTNMDKDYEITAKQLEGKTWGFSLITNGINTAAGNKTNPYGAYFTLNINKK